MKLIKIFLTLILITGLNFSASGQSFKGETAVAGGPPGTIFIAFAAQASKAGVDIEVNAGKTLTKSMCCLLVKEISLSILVFQTFMF